MSTEAEFAEIDNTPPPAAVAFDAEAASAIAAIAAEMEGMTDETPETAPDAPHTEGATEETVEAEAAPAEETVETAPVVEEEKVDPAIEKGFARLVEREVAIQARENALKAKEADYTALQSKLADAEKRIASLPNMDELGVLPGRTLRALGHDPEQVVRLYLAEKMQAEGRPVPEPLQIAIEKAQVQAELKAQRAELQRYQQSQAAQAFVAQVHAGAQQYVTTGDFKDAPTVAAVAKANPGRIYNEILDEISRDATSPGKDPAAPILSYQEAAARVEKRWADLKALLGVGPVPGASTPAVTTPALKTAPGKKPVVPNKPLTTPKPAHLSERELVDAIVRETMIESRKTI